MQFKAEEYFRVSVERMRQARELYQRGNAYALTMYCGGLAVEALLRAFRWKSEAGFEGRHNLLELLKASRLLLIDTEFLRRKGASETEIQRSGIVLRSAMNEVIELWHNNLRFASEASLKAFLKRIDRLQGIQGDALKRNAFDLLNAAQVVIDRGGFLWTSAKRS